MNPWLQGVIARAEASSDILSPLRQVAVQSLKKSTWPGRRTEHWKYTSLSVLENLELVHKPSNQELTVDAIENVQTIDLLFVDGKLRTDLAALQLPAGLTISLLDKADGLQYVIATSFFSQIKPKRHLFGLVNDALASDILFISVASQSITKPFIRIMSHHSAGHEAHQRVLVRVQQAASVKIIEQIEGQGQHLSTNFTEFEVSEHANLEHYRLIQPSAEALHFGGNHFCLHQHAVLNSTLLGLGSALSRTDIDILHNGEHADAKLNAIALLGESSHCDLHTNIEHIKAHGKTTELVRVIVGDKANAVFNGRIHIHPNAQKTQAALHNRNLLLSRRGQVNTKPELEIYADDVQCAHGATVAEIEEEALNYLQTRGIARDQALVMLNVGFIQELINQLPDPHLAQWLKQGLLTRLKEIAIT